MESTDSMILLVVHMIHITVILCNYSNSTRLQKLLNFTIDCTLQSNELECEVDGPTAVLPNNSTCQINDQPPMKCEPSNLIKCK